MISVITDLLAFFSTKDAQQGIRQYVVKNQLLFGAKYGTKFKVPEPTGGKLLLYNSFKELAAGRNNDGGTDFIDTKKNTNLGSVIIPANILKQLMQAADTGRWLKTYTFECMIFWNGRLRFFMYRPSQMWLDITCTKDPVVFERLQKAEALQQSCNEFAASARRNAQLLAQLNLRTDLTTAQRKKLTEETTELLYTVNKFKQALPPGVHLQKMDLTATNINSIGAIPLIIWVVAIIVTGTTVAVAIVSSKIFELAKHKATLDARYKSIMSITDDTTRNQALVDAATTDNKNMEAATADTGIMGQVKQIVVVSAIVLLAKQIFK
jgi:hypothetical protein